MAPAYGCVCDLQRRRLSARLECRTDVARGPRSADRSDHSIVSSRPDGPAVARRRDMARALWKGSIAFGLVNIPVELHTAVRDHRPRFRMLHATDKSPIQFTRV